MVPKEHRHSRSELGITRASGYAASCKINVQAQRKQHISIKTRRLLCKRTNIKRRVLSLRQGPRPGKDKRRSTNKVSLIKSKHTPSSAGRMPEHARIVSPHFLEHGKRQAVSQHKVKSGLQEVAMCRRSQSSDNTNPALSRHGSKLLPCSTTLHTLMEPLPQQYKTHKRPVPAQGPYLSNFFSTRQQHRRIRTVPMRAHAAKRTTQRCGYKSKIKSSNTKACKCNYSN